MAYLSESSKLLIVNASKLKSLALTSLLYDRA